MKQLLLHSLLVCTPIALAMDAVWISEEDPVTIAPFTNEVHQRYYYVARLKQAHNLLATLHADGLGNCNCTEIATHFTPKHPRIIACVQTLTSEQTIAPLLALRQDLVAYRYLSQDQFMKEYTQLLCMVAHHMLLQLHNERPKEKSLKSYASKSIADNLRLLDQLVNKISDVRNGKKTRDEFMSNPIEHENQTDSAPIGTHEVSYRYYLIKRLKPVHALFEKCNQMPCPETVLTKLPLFTHPHVANCVAQMRNTGTLEPVEKLLTKIMNFNALDDVTLIVQLLQLILVVEQRVLLPTFDSIPRQLFDHDEHGLDDLSIEELLKSIDILTTHIEPHTSSELPETSPLFCATPSQFAPACIGVFALWYMIYA